MTQAATPSVSAVMWMPYVEGSSVFRCTTSMGDSPRSCQRYAESVENGLQKLQKGKILTLVEEHSRPGVVVVFTDGSVLRGVKSGWGFSARVEGGRSDGG